MGNSDLLLKYGPKGEPESSPSTSVSIAEGGHVAEVTAGGALKTTATFEGSIGAVTAEGPASDGTAVKGKPVLMAGSDGTDAQTVKTNTGGLLETVGTVEGKTAAGSALTSNAVVIGGVDSSADVRPIKTNAEGKIEIVGGGGGGGGEVEGLAANGAAVSGNPVLMGGSDGTDARTLKTTSLGVLQVEAEVAGTPTVAISSTEANKRIAGEAASGSAVKGNPVLIAGSDATDARTILTSATGLLLTASTVQGEIASGQAVSTQKPVYVAGSDGTDVRPLKTNAEGKLETAGSGESTVVGKAASGAAVSGNPVLMGGSDGTDARTVKTTAAGIIEVASGSPLVVEGGRLSGESATGLLPVPICGSDGTDVRTIKTTAAGVLETTATPASSEAAKEFKVEVLNTSTEIKAAKARKSLLIQNVGKEKCWVSIGKAAAENTGFLLAPEGSWESPVAWQGTVFAICKTTKEALLIGYEME